MTVRILELDDDNIERWRDFVAACPQTTFFHRPEWKRVIENSFNQKCHFLMAEEDGRITGILPLTHVRSFIFGSRLVSTAFCVGGGIATTTQAAHDALKRHAVDLRDKTGVDYVEYRAPANSDEDWIKREGLYATFERPIEEEEDECLKQIPRKQRAVVRKALKTDLIWHLEQDSDAFYGVYSMTMRNHGTPVFSKKYIDNLLSAFGDDCDVLTVYSGDKPLSSVLNFYFKDRVMPYYTGAVPEARKLGAADLMYWAVMRSAVERGYKVFDFGRSKVGTGPFSFKKNWGFEPRPINLEFSLKDGVPLPDVNPNNPKYKMMIETWRRLPLPVANIIGPIVSRQVG